MKEIKRFSKILAIILVLSSVFCVSAFAHTEDCVEIEKNNKIYACLPQGYEYYSYLDGLCYSDEEGNTISFLLYENKFAPNGITQLNEEKIKAVFDYVYLAEGDLEYVNSYDITYSSIKKRTINGMQAYEIKGYYESAFIYPFCAYIFATKEDVIAVVYEDINEKITDYNAINHTISTIAINGTYLGNDKPAIAYNFEGLPTFEDAVEQAEESYEGGFYGDIMDDDIAYMVAIFIILFTAVPTVIVGIIGVVSIVNYSKNKKKLSKYERAYGPIEMYNAPMQYPQQNVVNTFSQNYGNPYAQNTQAQINPNAYGFPYGKQAQPVQQIAENPIASQPQEIQAQTVQNNLPPELQDSVKEDDK